MRIDSETVDRIKQATDILEVVGDYVSLKKRGANYTACCPFHEEKTPSFNVNPARQIYKCFGCGAAGDTIKFVMDIDGLGYPDALRQLAKKYHIEIEEEVQDSEALLKQTERESLFIVNAFASRFFQEQLKTTETGRAVALTYFRERGFNDNTLEKFGLGYGADGRDTLTAEGQKKRYNAELLEKAGLIFKNESGMLFDRFRERVIFPIHDVSGKVIAFGGRTIKVDAKAKTAKYINSPESEIYHKSNVLYGIHLAKTAIRQNEMCYLVEGYTDVISLHQNGIENVVASSGTALTAEQIKLISRFTANVTFLYDGDSAGIKAAVRGLDLALEQGLNVYVVVFPDNNDPDSYLKHVGLATFKEFIQSSAKDFISFKTEELLRHAANDPHKKASVINDLLASIVRIPDAIKRNVFFSLTADRLKIDEQLLISEGNHLLRNLQKHSRDLAREQPLSEESLLTEEKPPEESKSRRYYHEEAFIRLLLLFGHVELEKGRNLMAYVLDEISEINFTSDPFEKILEIYREAKAKGVTPTLDYFLEHSDEAVREMALMVSVNKYEVSRLWFERHEIYVPSEEDLLDKSSYKFIVRIKKAYVEEKLQEQMQALGEASDEAEIEKLQRECVRLKTLAIITAHELGIVIG